MPDTSAQAAHTITLEAKVLRANGDVEDLGTVAYWSRSPLKRAAARLLGVGRIRPKGQR